MLAIRNIVSTLFLAEIHYDLPVLIDELLNLYDHETDRQAVMLLLNWFRQLAAYGRLRKADFAQIEETHLSREEVKGMLVKALEREREIIRQAAKTEGKAEGIEIRNRQVVAAMHQNGFALSVIASILQLTPAEVTRLLQPRQLCLHLV